MPDLPRKVVDAYVEAIASARTGNFILHLRRGEVLGYTFEVKESLTDVDRRETVAIG